MNATDAYFRALTDYRKTTTEYPECRNQRRASTKANAQSDVITVVRHICTVDTDWVDAIEEGLVYIDKAVREDRQFIRSNGEVVDIEKVKNVSKESIVHLAQHSSFITRYTEGEDITPEKLYTVERLSDYAVYENRFLYMLLRYLYDFVTIRYEKILNLEYTYHGELSMQKKVFLSKQHLDFQISLIEERQDDPNLQKKSEMRAVIERIRNILEMIHVLLATPLMEEVGKAPMLKPPITKTNVLNMNFNFNNALKLYEFIAAYTKDGYEIREERRQISPLLPDVADEFSEIVWLTSFLTYEYASDVRESLRDVYQKEERRRNDKEIERRREKLEILRRKIKESGGNTDEYLLLLEEQIRALETENRKLQQERDLVASLQQEISQLEIDKKNLFSQMTRMSEKMDNQAQLYEQKLSDLRAEMITQAEGYEQKMAAQAENYQQQMAEQAEGYEQKITDLRTESQETLTRLESEWNTKLEEEQKAHADTVARYSEQILQMQADQQLELQAQAAKVEALNTQIREQNKQYETLQNEKLLTESKLLALRAEHHLISPDEVFTAQEQFEQLEKQYQAFQAFFKEEWRKTKSTIRKKSFGAFWQAIREKREKEFLSSTAPETEKAEEAPIDPSTPPEEATTSQPEPPATEEAIPAIADISDEPTEESTGVQNEESASNPVEENPEQPFDEPVDEMLDEQENSEQEKEETDV